MPIATHTFRVFVSSTFEDLKDERDALQRDVFPKLRALCEQHGARFQAIDLRWGVRDEAALDQQTMAICLREIQRCKATGVRPNFIALLGDRYGWRPLPVSIPASEFEALKPHLSVRDAEVALQWYRLDENAVPPEYCLEPRVGEFVESSAWNPVEESLLRALATAARAAGLSEKELIKYEASATHQEIRAGLGNTEEDRQPVFGFVRRRTGSTDPRLDALKSHLRVYEFDSGDMAALCELVLAQLTTVIEAEVKRFEDRPALDLEIEAHDRFAEVSCRVFIGREKVLKTIAEYIVGPERCPLVLHGESGSGKSAVMAKASQQYDGPGRLICRFIGASPESASGHALLTSLCRQIALGETPVDYAQLENAFRERLSVATAEQPLVLFIDALDQLATSDPARDVTWLPSELPPHVKVIVSATDDGDRLPEGLSVRLERMAQEEGGQALDELLRDARRTLQPWQRETVLAHFGRCGRPLYLKLAAEESRLWNSYTPLDACKLGEGVAGAIDTLFDRLASNANHGPTLVERSLGYLAAARYGLTEDEVLDVLTADDTVWSDFDQRKHHEVSERRLPVAVWSRLSLDLDPYLAERAGPGGTVIAFYHRQLAERVVAQFLGGTEEQSRHGDLSRYFSAKPAWLDEGKKTPNARRAAELVFQHRGAKRWTDAEATLFDCQFLFAKVATGMVLDLVDDYQSLIQEAPDRCLSHSQALGLIQGAIQLSTHVVAQDMTQFASQVVARLIAHCDKLDLAKFVDEITTSAPRPWLRALNPCLAPPGGKLLRTLEGHADFVRRVAVSPTGKLVISAHSNKTLKIWDLETGRQRRTLEGHSDEVWGVAVTPDGKYVVSASADSTLKVWDLGTGENLRTLEGHSDAILDAAITPDAKCVVSASRDKTLKVWDIETGRELLSLQGHSDLVRSVLITPDGERAISGSGDGTLIVWCLDTGQRLYAMDGNSEVFGAAVTPDGRLAISAHGDDTLKVWDLATVSLRRTLEGHQGAVWSVAVTPGGKYAVSGSEDRTLKVWDLDTGRVLSTLEGHADLVCAVAVTLDGKRAVSGSWDCTVKLWNLDAPLSQPQLDIYSGLKGYSGRSTSIKVIANAPDGGSLIAACDDGAVRFWDLETGRATQTLMCHVFSVDGLALKADGTQVVSAGDNAIKLWDLETGNQLRILEGHSDYVYGVAVTQNWKRVISASRDKSMKIWDLETGRLLRTLKGHSNGVSGVAITPDGKWAVSASWDNTLKVWDMATGQALRTLEGHGGAVHNVAITVDGKRAVSASSDKTLKVWDLETGRVLSTLEGHSDWVLGVAVTPDGERAASASLDKTLRLWDLSTGQCIASFSCDGPVRCCACAVEHRIASGDESGHFYFLALEEGIRLTPPGSITTTAKQSIPSHRTVGTFPVASFQPGSHGSMCTSSEIIEPRQLDSEGQLKQEIADCVRHWGPSHQNTILGRLDLAALFDHAGRRNEGIDIRRDVAKTCLSMDDSGLTIIRDIVRDLITLLELSGDSKLDLVLELKSKMNGLNPQRYSAGRDGSEPRTSAYAKSADSGGLASTAHPSADADGAMRRNLEYQQAKRAYREIEKARKGLPWWQRMITRKPVPPQPPVGN